MELGYHEIIDQILTAEAKKREMDPDVLKAIAWKESDWRQFNDKGKPIIGKETSDIGIMQINPVEYRRRGLDQSKSLEEINEELERLKKDKMYNIEVGADWAKQEYDAASKKFTGDEIIKGTYSGYNEGESKNDRFKMKKDKRDIDFWKFYNEKPWNKKINDEREYYGQYWD